MFHLISSFFSMAFLFLASDITLRFGIYGGVVLCASFFIASTLLYVFRNRLFGKRNPGNGKHLIWLICFIYLFETIVLCSWIVVAVMPFFPLDASPLLQSLAISAFFLLLLLLVQVRRTSELAITVLTFLNLLIAFMIAILLSNTIFLQKGLETVYHNLLHYHPTLLHESTEGMVSMFVLLTIAFFIRLYLLFSLHSLGSEKMKSHIFLVNLCIGSVLLAFSTMVLVGVTERVQSSHPNVLVIAMLQELMNSYVFLAIWIVLLLSSFISVIFTWRAIKNHLDLAEIQNIDLSLGLIFTVGFLLFFSFGLKGVYVIDILLFFTIWLAPLVVLLLVRQTDSLSASRLALQLAVLYGAGASMMYLQYPQMVILLLMIVFAFSINIFTMPAKSVIKR